MDAGLDLSPDLLLAFVGFNLGGINLPAFGPGSLDLGEEVLDWVRVRHGRLDALCELDLPS
jgi:hypothetical protein